MDTTTLAPVISTNPATYWRYVSEGGATIVFSYVGPSHLRLDGTVLRLRKTNQAQQIPCIINGIKNDDGVMLGGPTVTRGKTHQGFQDAGDDSEPDDPSIQFQHKVVSCLLPASHLPRLESVNVNRPWLEQLSAAHNNFRPIERQKTDHIDVARTKAVLASDLVGGDWIAVEIKPKWGFLPNLTHLSPETLPLKSNTCRFCMHSHFKERHKGEIASVAYCPLDLYSGDPVRVEKAVGNLWESWIGSGGCVNNLKIFARGKMIKPSGEGTSLVNELSANGHEQRTIAELRAAFTSNVVRLLLATPVLRILSALQRTLDYLDIEGLSKLWQLSQSEPGVPHSPIGSNSPEPSFQDWITFTDMYLSSVTSPPSPVPANLSYYLHAYLLSASFKDCSIILRLPIDLDSDFISELKPGAVTVIDLDPKPMDRLRKWEKLDTEIVGSYKSVREHERKICIDARMT